jgi:hypothetical protein
MDGWEACLAPSTQENRKPLGLSDLFGTSDKTVTESNNANSNTASASSALITRPIQTQTAEDDGNTGNAFFSLRLEHREGGAIVHGPASGRRTHPSVSIRSSRCMLRPFLDSFTWMSFSGPTNYLYQSTVLAVLCFTLSNTANNVAGAWLVDHGSSSSVTAILRTTTRNLWLRSDNNTVSAMTTMMLHCDWYWYFWHIRILVHPQAQAVLLVPRNANCIGAECYKTFGVTSTSEHGLVLYGNAFGGSKHVLYHLPQTLCRSIDLER